MKRLTNTDQERLFGDAVDLAKSKRESLLESAEDARLSGDYFTACLLERQAKELEVYTVCPSCCAFNSDFPPDTTIGSVCPICGEGVIIPVSKIGFFRLLALAIVKNLI